MSQTYEIAIIGGGIAGAALMYFLGGTRSVVLMEQETAPGYHSTGRSAAEFTRRFHSQAVGKLTAASSAFLISPPQGFSEVELLRRRGNLVIAHGDGAAQLTSTYERENASPPEGAAPIELLDRAGFMNKCAFLDPDWVEAAFFDPDCWDIEVENLLQGYLQSAKAAGGTQRQNCKVLSAAREGRVWHIETTQGSIRATTVVNAAGGWADEVAGLFGAAPLGLIAHRRTAINVAAPGYDVHAMPEISEIGDRFYIKPDAGQLLVSPADETPIAAHDVRPEEIDIAYAVHYLTEATTLDIRHVPHSWAGMRTFARDRLPVIGHSAKVQGFFWLAGLGGFGIQTSPAVGQMAATLLRGTPYDNGAAAFSPQRLGG